MLRVWVFWSYWYYYVVLTYCINHIDNAKTCMPRMSSFFPQTTDNITITQCFFLFGCFLDQKLTGPRKHQLHVLTKHYNDIDGIIACVNQTLYRHPVSLPGFRYPPQNWNQNQWRRLRLYLHNAGRSLRITFHFAEWNWFWWLTWRQFVLTLGTCGIEVWDSWTIR